jgi:hypothetical protein
MLQFSFSIFQKAQWLLFVSSLLLIEYLSTAYYSPKLGYKGYVFNKDSAADVSRQEYLAVYQADSDLDMRDTWTDTSPTQSYSPIAGLRKNLKNSAASPIVQKENWNDVKGLSEKELLSSVSSSSADLAGLKKQALNLAYRRCEYVTKLFSKTFYMGTSLMQPEARQHVWAIYAWCRRTDDIVDSPRALLDRDSLSKVLYLTDLACFTWRYGR